MSSKSWILIMVMLAFKSSMWAQACDDIQLGEAQSKYETGNFESVLRLLEPCLEYQVNDQKKMAALRLLALTSFAIDSVDAGNNYTSQLLVVAPNYQPGIFDSPRFIEAIKKLRKVDNSIFVTSVSKKAEDVKLTPGTILVITEEDIRNRGYTDLEALMTDLPGFDISRTKGATYSNIYQRGYRGNNTDRTLFLIDGVEENDLWSNILYWGTQFPLSSVKQVEVIYGPAATMYGPNAFTGVINVVTKDPSNSKNNKGYASYAEVGYGSYNTRYADVFAAGRVNNAALSITLRKYESDYRDLSGFEDYNYNPTDYNQVDYESLLGVGPDAFPNFDSVYSSRSNYSTFFDVVQDSEGRTIAVPTQQAVEYARSLDKDGLNRTINGNPIGYSNLADNIYFNAKLQLPHFTFGGEYWKARQGASGYRYDNAYGGAKNGTIWVPTQYFIYGKYENEIVKDKLFIQDFAQYRVTTVDDETSVAVLRNYSNLSYSAANLLDSTSASWLVAQYHQVSRQFRNELKLTYTPNNQFDIVSGLELRSSFIQGDYYLSLHSESESVETFNFPSVIETGTANEPDGGNYYETLEFGAYAQATYKLTNWLNLISGLRYDYNRIRVTGGYGSVFNPRLAVVAYPGKFILKAIYSSAFQNASNWTKFATFSDRELANPNLPPETVDNLDLSIGYQFTENLFADLTYYFAQYNGSVEQVPVSFQNRTTLQNQAVGEREIQGLQANLKWNYNNYSLYGNYTFTHPFSRKIIDGELLDELERIADIASHQFNMGINALYFNKLNVNLRFNYIGSRKTGEGTTTPANTIGTFDPVTLLNSAVMYKNLLPHLSVQVGSNNILDQEYSDPGIRTADGRSSIMHTPQNRRNYYVKLMYDL